MNSWHLFEAISMWLKLSLAGSLTVPQRPADHTGQPRWTPGSPDPGLPGTEELIGSRILRIQPSAETSHLHQGQVHPEMLEECARSLGHPPLPLLHKEQCSRTLSTAEPLDRCRARPDLWGHSQAWAGKDGDPGLSMGKVVEALL